VECVKRENRYDVINNDKCIVLNNGSSSLCIMICIMYMI